jgi:hypothetical protein
MVPYLDDVLSASAFCLGRSRRILGSYAPNHVSAKHSRQESTSNKSTFSMMKRSACAVGVFLRGQILPDPTQDVLRLVVFVNQAQQIDRCLHGNEPCESKYKA